MGSSGAGKSTLLNVLTNIDQRDVRRHAGSRVLVNGQALTPAQMRVASAYVQQFDLFMGCLTVEEQLRFAAALRMDRARYDARAREGRVRGLLARMNLERCRHTLIGVPGVRRGISVGEKKRLAFACELLTDPDFFFCDEPTSGLDSFMAVQVAYALHSLAKNDRKTVITTIHQPSDDVFNLFDKILFLSREGGEGRVAFFGPPSAVLPFLAAISRPFFAHRQAAGAMRILSRTSADSDASFEDRVKFIREQFEATEAGRKERARAERSAALTDAALNADLRRRRAYAVHWGVQVGVLFRRALRNILRDPILVWVRLVQIVLTAIAIGTVNFQTPVAGPTVVNLESILYNSARDMNSLFIFPMIHVITAEFPVVTREHRAGQYAASAYYVTVLPLLYATITYWMAGLQRRASKFAVHCAFNVLLAWTATSIAYAGACIFGTESLAQTIVPMLVLPMLLFGGYFINFNAIPVYFRWLAYLSWFRFGFEGMEINQWADIGPIAGCEHLNRTRDWAPYVPPNDEFCPAPTGLDLLRRRDIEDHGVWANFLCLGGLMLLARTVGLVALLVRMRWCR
ncbi:ABC transporter ATP-binding protein/permease wht-1 [Aphelenchoides fujianensis]|nr:ABC transporter ATP-binding protein/permease wht-1 [Aphelenchoides fujianensis]